MKCQECRQHCKSASVLLLRIKITANASLVPANRNQGLSHLCGRSRVNPTAWAPQLPARARESASARFELMPCVPAAGRPGISVETAGRTASVWRISRPARSIYEHWFAASQCRNECHVAGALRRNSANHGGRNWDRRNRFHERREHRPRWCTKIAWYFRRSLVARMAHIHPLGSFAAATSLLPRLITKPAERRRRQS